MVAKARAAYVDVSNAAWMEWGSSLLPKVVETTTTFDPTAELAALEAKYKEDSAALLDAYIVEDKLEESEYNTAIRELDEKLAKDKAEVAARAKGKNVQGREAGKSKRVEKSSEIEKGGEGSGSGAKPMEIDEDVVDVDASNEGRTTDDAMTIAMTQTLREETAKAPETLKPATTMAKPELRTMKATRINVEQQKRCDLCAKKDIPCMKARESQKNCDFCITKKQACKWAGLTLTGEKPKKRDSKKTKAEGDAANNAGGEASKAVGGKRKRSAIRIVESEEEESDEEKDDEIEEEEEDEVEDAVKRPTKSKWSVCHNYLANCCFLS